MPDEPEAPSAPKMTRVKCCIHNKPWTHLKPLEFGEEAIVPDDVALMMSERNQVFIMGDA